MDNVLTEQKADFISSGSKAEGLDMSGSDLDIMLVLKFLPVFPDNFQAGHLFGFITDTENAPPGFVLLRPKVSKYPSLPFITNTEYGPLLSNEKFKSTFMHLFNTFLDIDKLKFQFSVHGPCIANFDESVDTAICLKSQTWPLIAMKWLYRPRYSRWPSVSVVSEISNKGLIYVPIGSKFGATESNPNEWRISFSEAEKMLIHSFSHTQLLCYAMLKIILKEIIDKNVDISKLLCSYFMKTTIFWISEESDPSIWIPENLLLCYKSCLKRLIYWVRLGNCPNFFIPQNNMFEGKILGKSQHLLFNFLIKLHDEGVESFLRSKTLHNFISIDYREQIILYKDADKGIYPLLHLYLQFYLVTTSLPRLHEPRYIPILLKQINQARCFSHCQLIHSIYLLWLVQCFVTIVKQKQYNFIMPNKQLYPAYKLWRLFCLIGVNSDIVSGWSWLAAFFYRHKEYRKALFITDYVLSECTPDKIYVNVATPLVFKGDLINTRKTTFLQRHKLSCVYGLFGFNTLHSLFYNSDLNLVAEFTCAPPVVFIHFLRFMCYHHCGNIEERNKCIRDIRFTIEENFFTDGKLSRFAAYFYLIKALMIAEKFIEIPEVQMNLLLEYQKNQPS